MKVLGKVGSGLIILTAFLGATGRVDAATYVSGNASACDITDTDENEKIDRMTSGTGVNVGASSAFTCPLPLGTTTSFTVSHDGVDVYYVDGTSSVPFSCKICQTWYGGSYYCSAPRYSCSTSGGCNDSTTSYVGSGIMEWNSTSLTSNLTSQIVDGDYKVYCTVPSSCSITSYYAWAN